MVGRKRVKEPVKQGLRHPKAYLLQVSGIKAISHTPDKDRVLPIVPEGTREREGGRQGGIKGRRREQKTPRERRQRRSAWHEKRQLDNGEHSGQLAIACLDTNDCCSSLENLIES